MPFPAQHVSDLDRAEQDLWQQCARFLQQLVGATGIFHWRSPTPTAKISPLIWITEPPLFESECQAQRLRQLTQFIDDHHTAFSGGQTLICDLSQGNWWSLRELEAMPQLSPPMVLLSGLVANGHYLGGIGWIGSDWCRLGSQKDALLAWLPLFSSQCFAVQGMEESPLQQLRQQCEALENQLATLQQQQETEALNLSHIHHELRTPLTGILGFSKMLREELYGDLNPKQHQYVAGILNSAEHLLALVNDYLDLSKIDANCESLFLEKVAIKDLCRSVIAIVQPKAQAQGLALNLEIGGGVHLCILDQRRWKQILINLLANAIKFTEQGQVTLSVQWDGDRLLFTVIDTGIGISPEDQQQLFQPFKQINHALNRKQKGTGLGLALSLRLAQLHGGDITVTSAVGKGSQFQVSLPLRSEEEIDEV